MIDTTHAAPLRRDWHFRIARQEHYATPITSSHRIMQLPAARLHYTAHLSRTYIRFYTICPPNTNILLPSTVDLLSLFPAAIHAARVSQSSRPAFPSALPTTQHRTVTPYDEKTLRFRRQKRYATPITCPHHIVRLRIRLYAHRVAPHRTSRDANNNRCTNITTVTRLIRWPFPNPTRNAEIALHPTPTPTPPQHRSYS